MKALLVILFLFVLFALFDKQPKSGGVCKGKKPTTKKPGPD